MQGLRSSLQHLFIGRPFNNEVKSICTPYLPWLGCFSVRTTFILKRKYPVPLAKKGRETPVPLKGRHFVYELVENTETKKKPEVTVILREYVEGLGNPGDCVTVSRHKAYNHLLLPGLADYATPEAIELAKQKDGPARQKKFSSQYAAQTMKFLSAQVLGVVMNKEVEWTIEPWHIRVSFRKAGIHVPEKCIELPEKPIKGPNLDLELKDFIVKVTINNTEKVNVRCRLHHWSTNPGDRLPHVESHYTLPSVPIFPEESKELDALPLPSASEPSGKSSRAPV